ncbi:hypothetical protein J6500_02390 [Bradyrhizobium sp. WSM 1704]|uniref:hypothetical protein n=1 Tax=Bradyrhizobium semiaridum TaxID=2821404 RepID=UPI001CE2CBFB|nr:hypothetical protein [Bradyrhizobium semiaridum]MCA6120756.1 hypothetical protein [Bradyrhizobium semiaridum]
MRSASLFIAGIILFTMFASPAEARRFRMIPIPGFGGGGERIDLVYDLPNEPPFIRDGQGIDVGYLHSPKGNAYVLYQGDRYTKLGDAEIAMLTGVLGFDPAARHRAEYARPAPPQKERPNVVERRAGESAEDFEARKKAFIEAHRAAMAERAASRPAQEAVGGPTQSTTAGRTAGWLSALSIVAVVAILLGAVWKLRHRILRAKDSAGRDESMEASYASVDARIADRLSQLQRESSPLASASRMEGLSPAPSFGANTPVRAFGRRNA